MATDKKITELPVAAALDASNVSVMVSDTTDYQYTFTQLLQFLTANLTTGAAITFGTTLPLNSAGKTGDVFINTAAGSFAQKIAGIWMTVYTLPAEGSADGTLLYGAGIPAALTGKNGDSYINTLTGFFYQKAANAWAQKFSLASGSQGPQGAPGIDGTDGKDGNTVLFGTTDPSSTKGTDGDFYINTSTYDLFGPKTASAWGTGESLTGEPGPTGAKGDKGDTGATGPAGAIGATGATGIAGVNGTNGVNGSNGAPGAGVAAGGTGGQVLSKIDAADYNTQWITPAAATAPTGIITARDDNSGATSTPLIITNQGAKANNTGSKISFRAINSYTGTDALREYASISAVQTASNSSVYSTIQFFTLTNNVLSSILNINSSNVNITSSLGVQAGLQVGGSADTVTGSGSIGLTGRNLVFGNRAGYNFDIGSTGAGVYKILMRFADTNHISIGDENVDSSAVLTLNSTTNGFLPPRMSTAQRNAISSPTFGLMIANSTTKKINFYNGTNWEEVSSS